MSITVFYATAVVSAYPSGHQGLCSCGWQGSPHESEVDADQERREHIKEQHERSRNPT